MDHYNQGINWFPASALPLQGSQVEDLWNSSNCTIGTLVDAGSILSEWECRMGSWVVWFEAATSVSTCCRHKCASTRCHQPWKSNWSGMSCWQLGSNFPCSSFFDSIERFDWATCCSCGTKISSSSYEYSRFMYCILKERIILCKCIEVCGRGNKPGIFYVAGFLLFFIAVTHLN